MWRSIAAGLVVILALLMIVMSADASKDLYDKVIAHPNSKMDVGWHRVTEKDNLSNTDFDWRFNRKKIDAWRGHTIIGLREEQNSGQSPNSNWVIMYTFKDWHSNGTLDEWEVSRFISIETEDGTWMIVTPSWPDRFGYPQDNLTREQAEAKWKEELNFWKYKLKAEE